jgi:hypothetical protein
MHIPSLAREKRAVLYPEGALVSGGRGFNLGITNQGEKVNEIS